MDKKRHAKMLRAFELVEAYCGHGVRDRGPIVLFGDERAFRLACSRHGVSLDEGIESIRHVRGVEPVVQRVEMSGGRPALRITAG
jgi:hypothetical protein